MRKSASDDAGTETRPPSAICPLCGRHSDRQQHYFRLRDVAELFTSETLADGNFERMKQVLAQLWQLPGVRVMRCDGCEFGFADPFVAGTAEFYRLEAPDTPYPKDKWEYRRTLQSLGAPPDARSRLIDIGAGKGYFLSHLLERGWMPEQLVATEFSLAGEDAIGRLGITCLRRDIRALEHSAAFDVICMFQVLEHLDGYDALFDALARIGRPDAHLFIAVPNGDRIDFNERFGLQYDCPPNHISRWSPRSFEVLAARYGWIVEECELEPRTTMWQEAVYGAVNRYIRNSHVAGSWARLTYGAADRAFGRSGRANKLAKAAGMAASPDTWLAALRVAGESRDGGIPHALWLHLRRRP